jgi:long-subunit acyl-CoA synthetase (AMP-forming)
MALNSYSIGVLITHGALAVSTVANLHGNNFHKGGPLLSYLPLAHIYAVWAFIIIN